MEGCSRAGVAPSPQEAAWQRKAYSEEFFAFRRLYRFWMQKTLL